MLNLKLSHRLNTYQHLKIISIEPYHSPNFGMLHSSEDNTFSFHFQTNGALLLSHNTENFAIALEIAKDI